MNIINYEILINESTMHVISYLVLFIAIIVIGGWLTDLCIWPDTPMYMLSIILSVIEDEDIIIAEQNLLTALINILILLKSEKLKKLILKISAKFEEPAISEVVKTLMEE